MCPKLTMWLVSEKNSRGEYVQLWKGSAMCKQYDNNIRDKTFTLSQAKEEEKKKWGQTMLFWHFSFVENLLKRDGAGVCTLHSHSNKIRNSHITNASNEQS